MAESVRVERRKAATIVTIDRPAVKNALDKRVVAELLATFDALAAKRPPVVILTGAGDAFVSGADIGELSVRDRYDALARINSGLFRRIEQYPAPVIAAINGHALGGGLELALACDLRVASSRARFGQPEVGLGIIPGAGACYRLPRIIGLGRAKELILSARLIDADEALRIGLLTAVAEGSDVLSLALEHAGRMAKQAPLALRLAKTALDLGAYASTDVAMGLESLAQAVLFEDEDKRARMNAFLAGKGRGRKKGKA